MTVEKTDSGQTFVDEADVVISARGTLNDISWPKVEGFDTLKIPKMHSALWNDRYELTLIVETLLRLHQL